MLKQKMDYQKIFHLLLFLLTVLVAVSSSQNCTGNKFIKDGSCRQCGLNSKVDQDFVRCSCDSTFVRKYDERNVFEKPCYRIPSMPRNFKLMFVNGTSATFTWEEPSTTDSVLKTKYDIGKIPFNCQRCPISLWGRNIETLNFTKTDLIPYQSYKVVVCSLNEASREILGFPRICNLDSIIIFTTNKTVPSAIPKEKLELSIFSEKLKLSFPFPTISGSNAITINVKCNQVTISKHFTEENATNTFALFDQPCDTKFITCSLFAVNDVGAGPKTNVSFAMPAKECDKSSGTSTEIIIACVLIAVLVLASIIGASIFYKWKKTQDAIIKEWNRQIESANIEGDNLQLPFRPHNIYVDALDVETTFKQLQNDSLKQENDDDYLIPSDYDFEFPRNSLNILQRLGEGNFAVVFKAEAENICGKNGPSIVAVKVLKDTASNKDTMDFEEELSLMKSLAPHKNVVQLLGCCTRKGATAMIVEYLSFGDLLDVLRKSKQQDSGGKAYSMFSEEDFILFAHDIASGMNHLANNNIIHRDLACRNILVSKNRCCKVADLGLARIIDEDGIYKREKEAKLPVKWMAPESLFYGKSSIKSDVWSFGITFWEIITLGASPYPGYKSKDVVSLLQQSYRMPKPSHCVNKLYEIMMDCWEENASRRPSFKDLEEGLYGMLHQDEANYMNFEAYEEDLYVTFDDGDDEVAADYLMASNRYI